MRTDMSSGLTDGQLDQIVGRTPLGRLAESRDVTPLLVFLMSKQASFITGEVILIDGGISS
jgi:3-oxoacyl-[acyl-carrier protein] reductase